MTKIFCDIADINQIKKFNKKKIVKGFTTNPSLMRKAGAKDYAKYSKDILANNKINQFLAKYLPTTQKMILQGNKINKWGKNVFVKVPVTNSKGQFMGAAINYLNKNKVKLNITAVYTAKQTKQILSRIDKKTKVIISIFGGRMADAGKDPVPEFKKSIKISKKFQECRDTLGKYKRAI